MKKITFAAAILIAASTLTVKADPLIDNIISAYQDGGFTGIEIYDSTSTVKVEAYRDGIKYEVVYDRATGAEISSEVRTRTERDGEGGASGRVRGSDDGPSHDLNDDHGRNGGHHGRGHDDDDHNDDHDESRDDSDDDSNDDS